MPEIAVTQLSPEWFTLRRKTHLTASQFADATGLGLGKPYDFLASLLDNDDTESSNAFTQHGITQEPIIDEAYQLLTTTTSQPCGLWFPDSNTPLHGLVAASPDRKILHNGKVTGVCEYKAPVHCLYDPIRHPHGIPRRYMAQIQGQMAVCQVPWCDFMAVCTKTKQICLKRVYFCASFWKTMEEKLKRFISVLQEAKERKHVGLSDYLVFPAAQKLRHEVLPSASLPGEKDIVVVDSLQRDRHNRYSYKRGPWVHYDVLMGDIMTTALTVTEEMLRKLDREIALKVG